MLHPYGTLVEVGAYGFKVSKYYPKKPVATLRYSAPRAYAQDEEPVAGKKAAVVVVVVASGGAAVACTVYQYMY